MMAYEEGHTSSNRKVCNVLIDGLGQPVDVQVASFCFSNCHVFCTSQTQENLLT